MTRPTTDRAHDLIRASLALPRAEQTRPIRQARRRLRRALMESSVGRPDALLDRLADHADRLAAGQDYATAAALRAQAARFAAADFTGTRPTPDVEAWADRLARLLDAQDARPTWQPFPAVVARVADGWNEEPPRRGDGAGAEEESTGARGNGPMPGHETHQEEHNPQMRYRADGR